MSTTQIIYGTLSATTFSASTIFLGNNQLTAVTQFTGGTISGSTTFTNGLTANTISATTVYITQPDGIVGTQVWNPTEAMVSVNRTLNNWGIFGVDASEVYLYSVGSGDTMSFYTNQLRRMSITPSGNVGIGTNNPTYKLDVSGNTNINGDLIVTGKTILTTLTANTISATTYQNLPQTTSANTATIHFSSSTIFGSYTSPLSTNITDNLSGSKLGITQKIYHNSGTSPSVPAGWVLLGSTTYQTNVMNIIYAEWSEGSRVEYWIVR